VAKRPSKANADRQPRQSNGQAIPPIIPVIPPELAPKPAPGPPAMGARGINVGLRLKNSISIYYFFILKINLHSISIDRSVWSWPDGHYAIQSTTT
jgi:hypothetical protein